MATQLQRNGFMVLALGLSLPACGGDASGPGDGNALVGSWAAVTMAGDSLPIRDTYTDSQFGECSVAITGMEMSFDATMHFDTELVSTMQCGAFPEETQHDNASGIYRLESNHIYFRDEAGLAQEQDMVFSIRNRTLTLSQVLDGETWVYTFRKK